MSSDYEYSFRVENGIGYIAVDQDLDGIILHPINSEEDLVGWNSPGSQAVVEQARRWLREKE